VTTYTYAPTTDPARPLDSSSEKQNCVSSVQFSYVALYTFYEMPEIVERFNNKPNCCWKGELKIVESYPGEAEAADGVSEHVSEQWRKRIESREVGVHVRTLPVSYLKQ